MVQFEFYTKVRENHCTFQCLKTSKQVNSLEAFTKFFRLLIKFLHFIITNNPQAKMLPLEIINYRKNFDLNDLKLSRKIKYKSSKSFMPKF